MTTLPQQIAQAARLISRSRRMVAMTGAGISTPSGIPDFRSPASGMWDSVDPLTVASILAFRRNPAEFYAWIQPYAHHFLEARPNPAHAALVALERAGKLTAIITQNIDGLHQQAGSQTVYELHGHLRQVTCLECHEMEDGLAVLKRFVQDGRVPRHRCGGVLKPNIVLFGEELPIREFVAAQLAVQEADLVLVAGSSLEVAPAASLPELAQQHGAQVILLNYQPTYLDTRADLVITADVAEVLPHIVELVQS